MFRSLSSSLVWRGLFALAVGLFAIAAFADAFTQGARAFSSDGAGPVIGHLLLGLIDVAAGVIALASPGITAYVLTIFIAAWAVVTGIGEFALAFGNGETSGQRTLFAL